MDTKDQQIEDLKAHVAAILKRVACLDVALGICDEIFKCDNRRNILAGQNRSQIQQQAILGNSPNDRRFRISQSSGQLID